MSFDSLLNQSKEGSRMQEEIIVYRRDFYRNCEYNAHKSVDNSKVFRENMKKRNAPDKCWVCIHFGKCRIINPEDCNGDKHNSSQSTAT